MRWNQRPLGNGRWYANNGRLIVYANSCDQMRRMIRQHRHEQGVVSQRKDGSWLKNLSRVA